MLRFDPCKSASAADEFFQTDGILRKSREDSLIPWAILRGRGYRLTSDWVANVDIIQRPVSFVREDTELFEQV